MLNSFFSGDCFDLSDKEIKDVELVVLLLASAEKFRLQSMVHYYTKALHQKIDRETGANTSKIRKSEKTELLPSNENPFCLKPTSTKCYEMLPIAQVSVFAGIQAIVEHVASARKVHCIDLAIRKEGQ
ncbi:hypothetical protein SLEP1_g60121 [Rubroshorea leprosula]|uniref:Uncharacterized protein n=1 Tax=Rubroshorea leprosula TaxID=152421 RepID=A0AAV5MVH8_9ROSI|nr:hypothetical protein SLEP1_g60121 [Rubroshorea leprosula]